MSHDQPFTDTYLESMRQVGDPSADAVIASLFSQGDDAVKQVSLFLRGLVENDDLADDKVDPRLRDFLHQTSPPAWADMSRCELAARIFRRYAPHIVTMLNLYALPMTYTAAKGVKVLARTNRLQSNATRRITETAQMIIDCMRPGGLDPSGQRHELRAPKGIRSAQKVRLLHATIRYLIQNHDPSWSKDWGVPVNQEDMAGTMLSFSVLILDGLQRIGIELSADERGAYHHAWNVVGHYMGVHEDLLVHDIDRASQLALQIVKRQAGACPEGQALTQALVGMLEHMLPGNMFDNVPVRLMRYFIGDDAARTLGLPEPSEHHHHHGLLAMFRAEDLLKDHAGWARRASELFGRAFLHGLLFAFRGIHRQPYDLPTELRQEWGLNWKPM
jgi:hypothetical protein